MRHYGDEYPRHGHRNPCEIAEDEILAALRDELCSVPAYSWQTRFKVGGNDHDNPRSNAAPARSIGEMSAASGRGG